MVLIYTACHCLHTVNYSVDARYIALLQSRIALELSLKSISIELMVFALKCSSAGVVWCGTFMRKLCVMFCFDYKCVWLVGRAEVTILRLTCVFCGCSAQCWILGQVLNVFILRYFTFCTCVDDPRKAGTTMDKFEKAHSHVKLLIIF